MFTPTILTDISPWAMAGVGSIGGRMASSTSAAAMTVRTAFV